MAKHALLFLALGALACGSDPGDETDESDALFQLDHIVEIEIDITEQDWDELRNQSRTLDILLGGDCLSSPFGSPFSYFPADVTVDGQRFDNVGLRKKGFLGSLDTTKPSLKIKLDEFEVGQELYGYERLTLNNNKQDPSHIRQCMSYRLFEAAGVPAPRCNFAHVVVNGEDMGVFSNIESVKKQFLRRRFDDDEGMLFEGTLSDFRDTWKGTFEPKTREDAPDFSAIEDITRILDSASDAELVAQLDEVLDVDAFLSYWATEVLVAHGDGYANNTNNYFLYQDPGDGRVDFLPWGTDGTFHHLNIPRNPDTDPPRSVYLTGILAKRLYQIADTRARYIERLQLLLNSIWNETALGHDIDRIAVLVGPLAATDPLHGERDFGSDVDVIRDFIDERRALLMPELSNPPEWDRPLRDSFCFEEIGSIVGSFDTTFGTLPESDIFATGTGTFAASLNSEAQPSLLVGSKAGTDNQDANVAQIQIASLVDNTAGAETFLVLALKIPIGEVIAGTHDVAPFSSVLFRAVPAQSQFELLGFVSSGTISLSEASTTDTAPIVGSFDVTIMDVPF